MGKNNVNIVTGIFNAIIIVVVVIIIPAISGGGYLL